jgi:hypothetical protein
MSGIVDRPDPCGALGCRTGLLDVDPQVCEAVLHGPDAPDDLVSEICPPMCTWLISGTYRSVPQNPTEISIE